MSSEVRLANGGWLSDTDSVHIPDGFLDAKTCVGTYCVASAGLAWAGQRVSARWNERTIPLLGVM